MTRTLTVKRAGPGVTVQDLGRPGHLAGGLSRGGAADRLALAEGAALLGQDAGTAALEMAGAGGEFEASEDMRIALTGAPMRASLDGTPLVWDASHLLPRGGRLKIGGCEAGCYGYLHLGGGVATDPLLGSRSAHLGTGLGRALQSGDRLPVGADPGLRGTGQRLDPAARCEGGTLRVVAGPQTGLFTPEQIRAFENSTFRRDVRGNRMGMRLISDAAELKPGGGLTVVSEVIVPGDIQITGDGSPFVLLSECQTTGGYPRIGSVLPADLPLAAQARPGTAFRFQFVTMEEAMQIEHLEQERRQKLSKSLRPLLRDPRAMFNLLSYQLISGATSGDDLERENR
ncbi:biotin-dependent carboxyltransferase family protein [Leisingera sp. SS27]|uniref:5-oxoprolinase subunit C family protein n=1 Tax=Leisingera sp. SS27 TaxID=2979462 RepID=UPI00232B88F1|nr:biotin-dependent carboxyltransferase family protein [Leisingera sp. SS27]MDC0659694.1 biotin-dependent carboxyltransferase family protein [Leisingera sp. SS27]